jgi:tRNA 5-methylaminomethyl-2-thiouridine biosynthesis bifunctional protein
MADSASAAPATLARLTQAWAGLPSWRVLDTRLGSGEAFLSVWRTWQTDPQAPHLLHYVALTTAAPTFEQLLQLAHLHPAFQGLIDELKTHWQGLLPGFHRLVLNEGRLLFTLCVGELTPLLREQQFEADAVFLDPGPSALAWADDWDKWTVKALARCCQRGTLLGLNSTAAPLFAELKQSGFQFTAAPVQGISWGTFNPHWPLKRSRSDFNLAAKTVGTCAVIGAGLAGASVAAALAKRGWQVQVLDGAALPACGASGLPVGLVVPHVSRDDCAQSRLSRSGVRLTLQQARQHLQNGQDWADTGVLEKQLTRTGLPQAPRPADVMHTQAAWLKPAALVRAWLAQPGVQFVGNAGVALLKKQGAHWLLEDALGRELCRADRVVFANAGAALPLLETLLATQPPAEPRLRLNRLPSVHGMRGLISWGLGG